jgi:ligand-binding SRPBCC domain-containing protein
MRSLEFKQFLPVSVPDAWKFFSHPANLGKITPPEMNFIIRSDVPDDIYPGLIIRYTVSPLFAIPLNWVTEITHVEKLRYFVDEQRSGPYSIWHHEHHFEEAEGGVMMTDRLFYKVPGGIFGRLLDSLIIKRRVEGIFSYRAKILAGRTPYQI